MNLVTIIENIELERTNNKALGEAVDARLASMQGTTELLLSQARVFVEQLEQQQADIIKAVAGMRQAFADRDAALLALIGGE